jgi:hypothetical protein
VGVVQVLIESQGEPGNAIVVVKLSGMFRLAANLERKDSLNAFTKRADAVAWLRSEVTASP